MAGSRLYTFCREATFGLCAYETITLRVPVRFSVHPLFRLFPPLSVLCVRWRKSPRVAVFLALWLALGYHWFLET